MNGSSKFLHLFNILTGGLAYHQLILQVRKTKEFALQVKRGQLEIQLIVNTNLWVLIAEAHSQLHFLGLG
jgi:hypothetical protein